MPTVLEFVLLQYIIVIPWAKIEIIFSQTLRPTLLVPETNLSRPLIDMANNFHPWTDPVRQWTIFLETANSETPQVRIPYFNNDTDVMLFFKFYDPATEKIEYLGHMYVSIKSNLSNMIPELSRRAKLPANTQVHFQNSWIILKSTF